MMACWNYTAFYEALPWAEAQARCLALPGGILAEPRTQAQWEQINDAFDGWCGWLGATDRAVEGDFRWASDNFTFWTGGSEPGGRPVNGSFTTWGRRGSNSSETQPDAGGASGSEDCLQTRGQPTTQYSKCTNTCALTNGVCDDGGPGAETSICATGTDCADCGSRDFTGRYMNDGDCSNSEGIPGYICQQPCIPSPPPPAPPSAPIYFFGPSEENGHHGCCRLRCEGEAGRAGNASHSCNDPQADTITHYNTHANATDAWCRARCATDASCTAYEHTDTVGNTTHCEIHSADITTSQTYTAADRAAGRTTVGDTCLCFVKASAAPPPVPPSPPPPSPAAPSCGDGSTLLFAHLQEEVFNGTVDCDRGTIRAEATAANLRRRGRSRTPSRSSSRRASAIRGARPPRGVPTSIRGVPAGRTRWRCAAATRCGTTGVPPPTSTGTSAPPV